MVYGMFEESENRIAVEPVGKPGQAWLELRGSILIFRRESWVTSASLFIPVEWINVSFDRKLDLRRLWHGLLGVMAAVLFALPLGLLLFRMQPNEPVDLWIGVALGVFLLTALFGALWYLLRFPKREPVTILRVEGHPIGTEIAFWHRPGEQAHLDQLVESVNLCRRRVAEEMPFPVRMNHMWHRPRPYRIAVIKGLAVSFFLYMALLVFEAARIAGIGPEFTRWLYLLLLAPPLVQVIAEAMRQAPLFGQPVAYRAGLRAYLKGDLDLAREYLDALLRDQPRHAQGRILMVQACAEAYAFDQATQHCDELAEENPLLASRLQASLWGLKRIYERMETD